VGSSASPYRQHGHSLFGAASESAAVNRHCHSDARDLSKGAAYDEVRLGSASSGSKSTAMGADITAERRPCAPSFDVDRHWRAYAQLAAGP
jgi:hypothetical protein